MKLFFATLLLVLFNTSVAAAQDLAVKSLNLGECWVGKVEDNSPVKIVHFGAKTAWQLYPEQFQEMLASVKDEIAPFGLLEGEVSVESLFHCASSKGSFVLNIKTPESRVCVWADMDHERFRINRLGVEPKAHNGHCTGAVNGDIILTLAPKVKKNELISQLDKLGFWDQDSRLRDIGKNTVMLSLGERFWFKEERIIHTLQEELGRQGLLKAAELNYYPHSMGEFHRFDELSGAL